MSLKEQTHVCNDAVEGHGPWTLTLNQPNLYDSWITKSWHSQWRGVVQKWCPNRSRVLQAGGWQGLFPELLSDHFDHVITLEPEPTNFYCLVNNCQSDKIVKMQAALGASCGWAVLDKTENSGQHRINHNEFPLYGIGIVNQYSVPMVTVDSLNLPDLGLLFLDIENYEIFALQGAVETLRRTGATVIVERSFLNDVNIRVHNLLADLGYKIEEDFSSDLVYVKAR